MYNSAMDSTPTPITTDHLLSLNNSSSPRKLPIKRKTPLPPTPPSDDLRRQAPFKFHRIWTESDEIRFLRSLHDSSLSFPRDLNLFFTRFSAMISHPYTKSQLSEKLRRLRKKWRVVSTRLAKGLDLLRLSPHDRTLFDLSEKLWHPAFSNTSPFGAASALTLTSVASKNKVKVHTIDNVKCDDDDYNHKNGDNCCDEDVKLSELKVEEIEEDKSSNEIGKIVAKTAVDLFDESLKDVKLAKRLCFGRESQCESFEKRWQELRVVEMEVLAQRLRLVVEDSIQKR